MTINPSLTLTSKILNLCVEISRSLGRLEGIHISRPELKLRKSNRIRTIQASLAIEGNSLDLGQVTAILEGKRVLGSKQEIVEVRNAAEAYNSIFKFRPYSSKSLREAHRILMAGLLEDAGKWRQSNVGIFQGKELTHAAPQAKRVPELMDKLFSFLKAEKEIHPLVLSALFHYELEFIHPFSDGNGRIGRLWQTVLLSRYHPIFAFTPVEVIIRERQPQYYDSLGLSDRTGSATPFIEFSLATILEALESLKSSMRPEPLSAEGRLKIAREKFGDSIFSRKEYLAIFKTISTATASRDLALAVNGKRVKKTGEKALAKYQFL